jgi:WD40 repeat protein
VSVGEHGRILYRQANDDRVEHTFYICNAQVLAFSDDGKLLAAVGGRNGSQGKIKVWQLNDHKQLCEIAMAGEPMRTVALATDGNIVVAANCDGSVEAWRVSDRKLQWSRRISKAEAIQFAPDGKGLLVQCADGTGRLLDPAKGRNLFQPKVAKD